MKEGGKRGIKVRRKGRTFERDEGGERKREKDGRKI